MSRIASLSKSGSTLRATFGETILPFLLTTNCTITRPCVPFSFAIAGYFIFSRTYSATAPLPPGNSGIFSATQKTPSSDDFPAVSFFFTSAVSFTTGISGTSVRFTTAFTPEATFSTVFVSTIAAKSLTLTAEISFAF